MQTDHLVFISRSPAQTRHLGQCLGAAAFASVVLVLKGDLGSGKTVFVQGLAHGLGLPADAYVTSPSYTLVNEYPTRHRLYHVDLYRLDGPADAADIGLDDALGSDGVIAIEWADRLGDDLPSDYICIALQTIDDQVRRITVTAYGLAEINMIKALEAATASNA